MFIIRPCDLPNKHVYYAMLCKELDRICLDPRVADASKQYLYITLFYEE
jgi:hypothetical protein